VGSLLIVVFGVRRAAPAVPASAIELNGTDGDENIADGIGTDGIGADIEPIGAACEDCAVASTLSA
jgi:hypothetical protein